MARPAPGPLLFRDGTAAGGVQRARTEQESRGEDRAAGWLTTLSGHADSYRSVDHTSRVLA
ncbi:hypothetical protein GCM10017744_007070 [Streptomyces antimycoticus]|uniref:Uncharacterized protein n=1 Tax=Streptomyces antimycoticus TaxID=68175 RepID=A0A4D4KRB0_9ACTN|nr:hypothetical protein SANT12839_092910 [Streptomyces antimycoticus]